MVQAWKCAGCGSRDQYGGAYCLCKAEERRNYSLGGLEDARRSIDSSTRSIRKVGSQGNQSRLHATQRSACNEFLHKGEQGSSEAEDAGGFSRRPETCFDDAHMAQLDQRRRSPWDGVEQVERRGRAGTQRHITLYADVSRSDGLHTGSHAQRRERQFYTRFCSTNVAGYSLSPIGYVRRLRRPTANAG